MRSLTLRETAMAGLIAAAYVVLATVLAPISFGIYQVRVSEALTVLPFVIPAAIPGLFVGCLLANVIGGLGWMDIVFGSLLTLAAALATRGIYHLSNRDFGFAPAYLPPLLLWVVALRVLMVDHFMPVAVLPVLVAIILLILAEIYRSRVGRPTGMVISLRVSSLILVVLTAWMFRYHPEQNLLMLGGLALLAAWILTWLIANIRAEGGNPALALAPLPPVVFNAFGVAFYLAPIMGVDYWFAVQMIGIGQLVACYLLGLPLLLIVEKRKSVLF